MAGPLGRLQARVRTLASKRLPALWQRWVAPYLLGPAFVDRRQLDPDDPRFGACTKLGIAQFADAGAPFPVRGPKGADVANHMRHRYRKPREVALFRLAADRATVAMPSGVVAVQGRIPKEAYCGLGVFKNPRYMLPQARVALWPAPMRAETGFFLYPAWSHNFYHWMVDVLPRLEQYLDGPWDGVPVVVAEGAPGFVGEALSLFLNDQQILRLGTGVHGFRMLHIPSQIAPNHDISDDAFAFLNTRVRAALLARAPEGERPRRILVSRADAATRRVANEDAVMAALAPLGFQRVTMAGRALADQAALFDGAEMIVAPHGAALVHLAFARPGARVVELFDPRYVSGCYMRIARKAGLPYGCVAGVPNGGDITVDPADVVAMLEELGPEVGP